MNTHTHTHTQSLVVVNTRPLDDGESRVDIKSHNNELLYVCGYNNILNVEKFNLHSPVA